VHQLNAAREGVLGIVIVIQKSSLGMYFSITFYAKLGRHKSTPLPPDEIPPNTYTVFLMTYKAKLDLEEDMGLQKLQLDVTSTSFPEASGLFVPGLKYGYNSKDSTEFNHEDLLFFPPIKRRDHPFLTFTMHD